MKCNSLILENSAKEWLENLKEMSIRVSVLEKQYQQMNEIVEREENNMKQVQVSINNL